LLVTLQHELRAGRAAVQQQASRVPPVREEQQLGGTDRIYPGTIAEHETYETARGSWDGILETV
jgi:hypothetical protein